MLIRPLALLAAAAVTIVLLPMTATHGAAEDAAQVEGLEVAQHPGFATLTWDAAPGVTEYVITRTPVDAGGLPTGAPVVAGVWRPNRQVHQDSPSFADSGFTPGERFEWRVVATPGVGVPVLPLEPVVGMTLPPVGPDALLTQFELTGGAQWTSHESELAWTQAIDAASDRVRVETLGHTVEGRPINLFVMGGPTAPATVEEVMDGPRVATGCLVHGNEPSGREACFMMIRELAFSEEAWATDILEHATVLIIPSFNGDGRAANTRGNSTGQDLNRDYGRLSQPETHVLVEFFRDYQPQVMTDHHQYGNTATCDLPLMNTPHLNNAPVMYDEARFGLIEGWLYDEGAADGWWPCPYPVRFSAGAQSFGSTSGLKHVVGSLVEARSSGGPTRPDETNTPNNRRRMTYSQLWTMREAYDYHRANLPTIEQAITESIIHQSSNLGRVVFDGTYDWEPEPAPHPGDTPPGDNRPDDEGDQLATPPCGYLLSEAQWTTPLADSPSLPEELRSSPAERLAAHGIAAQPVAGGWFVPMAQPLRGLIPLILDGQAADLGIPIILAAERMDDCPSVG